jgi:hypothetical protein
MFKLLGLGIICNDARQLIASASSAFAHVPAATYPENLSSIISSSTSHIALVVFTGETSVDIDFYQPCSDGFQHSLVSFAPSEIPVA